LQNLKVELEELIKILENTLTELRPTAASAPPEKTSIAPKEKWSKENHPAYQAGYRKPAPEDEKSVVFQVNDTVLAKWKSGDKGMYPAKITSITGSSNKPVYIVRFKAGGDTETVFAHELKPLSNESKKRKADGTPVTPTTPSTPTNPNIISAAANINTALASQMKKDSNTAADGQPKPAKVARKVKANKELEAGKSKWQEFTTKGKFGKATKKDSIFRTGEGVNARGKC
jgi:survival of motor neuron-related-splicing factor 30